MQARELGPFASARQLVQGRAAAMAAHTEKILNDASAVRDKEEVRRAWLTRKGSLSVPCWRPLSFEILTRFNTKF